MAKVEDLKNNSRKQPIIVENSGTRISNTNGLSDLSTRAQAQVSKSQDIEDSIGLDTLDLDGNGSRYDMGKAEELAAFDDKGLKKTVEEESLSLIDVHMERKKREMEEYFTKEDERRELDAAIGESVDEEEDVPAEEKTYVETEDEISEESMDEFEEEMEREFMEDMEDEMSKKYEEAEKIADDFLSNLDDEEDTTFEPENDVMDEEKPIDFHKSKEEINREILEDVMTPHPVEKTELPESISSNIDEDDFKDLEEDDDVAIDEDPLDSPEMKELQKSITEKIHTVSNKLDLSSFTISKKPISITAALNRASEDIKCADWALMSSERPIRMSEFTGAEMEKLISAASQRRLTLRNVQELYGLLYKHDINPDKPKTLEAWLKTTSSLDADHLFMAAYAATFGNSNHVPYNCVSDKCGAMWITDNRPIMDMVRFKNKESKKKFHDILHSTPGYTTNFYKTEVVQISDHYAIGIKVPSIYDAVFEMAALDSDFRNKYSDFITILQYCDEFYSIDPKTRQLLPIEYKKYPSNMNKNTKSKIFTYSKILSTLSTDQYTSILAFMREINTTGDDIEYIIPESTCTKCGETIPESRQSARDLLFTRHQLTALRTI